MLDRPKRKQGPLSNADKQLADMRHAAIGFWIWQEKEKKKRERAANKKHKKEEEEQAAKELVAAQKALDTLQEEEEYDYEAAYVKEDPEAEMDAHVEPPVSGPFNFVDPRELHDLKPEPQEEEEYPAEDVPQANGDNEPMQAKPGCSAVKEAARTVKVTEEVGSTKTAAKKYPTRANLNKTLPGPYCDKSSSAGSKSAHLSSHAAERPHRCSTAGCDKSFARKDHLQKLLQTHADHKRKARENSNTQKTKDKHKKSPCPVCGRELTSGTMKRHVRSHTGERPHTCTVCGKAFRRAHHLLGHMRTHTGERPFKCDECGTRFVERSALRHHKAHIHSAERPHKCDTCPASFVRPLELTLHIKVHTSGGPIFPCKTCGRAFSQNEIRCRHSKKCQAV